MNEAQPQSPLFPEFSPVSPEAWEARIRKDLREAPYDALNWPSPEGITVKPFYTRHDLPQPLAARPNDFPYVRTCHTRDNRWENVPTFSVRKDARPVIDRAVNALERGATGVHFHLKEPVDFDFEYLLQQQPAVRNAFLSFTFPVAPETYLEAYLQAARKLNVNLDELRGFIAFDPADDQLYKAPAFGSFIPMLELVKDAPGLYPITLNGHQFSNRGSLLHQEIALVLSSAICVLTSCQNHNIAPEKIMSRLQFTLTAGTNYFFEIAKLRALRLLWSAIVSSYGVPAEVATRLRVHVATSRWFQTVFDPHVNLLRSTTEAMSAILGGCDSLSIAPYDSLYKPADDFSERIARNISVILKEEAYLDKAIDPAAGAYYLETLTKQLAEKAWAFFQEIEGHGGFVRALETGFISGEITKAAELQYKALTNREQILVGTNKFPNQQEKLDFDPEHLMQNKYFDTRRAAYSFEVMRLASELHFRKKKKKARAIIAVIGTKISEHIHATFAREFFDCANFETMIYQFETLQDAINGLENDKAKVIVLSGSEADYQQFDKTFTDRIRSHDHQPVLIMAATPVNMEDEMVAKGFDQFIFHGCDIHSIINCIQKKVLVEDEPLD